MAIWIVDNWFRLFFKYVETISKEAAMIQKRVGVMTGGGDCPGLNAVIRAVVRKGIDYYGYEFLGILNGWKGLLEMNASSLGINDVSGILHVGGTILGTSRTDHAHFQDDMGLIMTNYRRMGLSCLIIIGGDGTLKGAAALSEKGLNIIGVPKTIDNDLSGTDQTFGFDTAVAIATEAIDRLHSTAESHHRVMVVEVMGRNAGWIAAYAGIAGGADLILVPEEPFTIDDVIAVLEKRKQRGRMASIIVLAEGATLKGGETVTLEGSEDQSGHGRLGGIGQIIAKEIEKETGHETRMTVLGHVQRGGSPTAFDRILATRFGIKAIDLIHDDDYGKMVSLQGNQIGAVDLKTAAQKNRLLDKETYEIARVFFG